MTQLVKKDSSWRTLRRKAVVGASSFALVAGMGVAIAPSALAAENAPTITVTAPDEIANDGLTTAKVKVEIKTGAGANDGLAATTAYQLAMKLPDNASCATITANPADIGANISTTVAYAPTGDSLAGTNWAYSGAGAPTCTLTFTGAASTNDGAIAAGSTVTATFTVAVDTHKDAAGFTPASDLLGNVTFTFGINDGGTITSASGTSALVKPYGPVLSESAIPTPQFGSVYKHAILEKDGFPAVPADDKVDGSEGGYTAVGASFNKTTQKWDTTTDLRGADDATEVVVNGDSLYYISLNDNDFYVDANYTVGETAPAGTLKQSGYFFETTSATIVYGTLSAAVTNKPSASGVVSATKFVASAVSTRGTSTKTWTILLSNLADGAAKGSNADGPKPKILAGQYATAQFTLQDAFSDVSADNVFADAINALAGANPTVIKGLGDGSFGATNNVTRAEFAEFMYRALGNAGIPAAQPTTTDMCTSNLPSRFNDVANTNLFCKSINELAAIGVINGTSATSFAPNAQVTRDQAAAFIFRLNSYVLGQAVGDATRVDTQFTDVTKANFASGDIKWGAANGIINGRTATTFDPGANVLRQEAAAFLYRFGNGLYGAF